MSSLLNRPITKSDQFTLFNVTSTIKVSVAQLKAWLPTVEIALWFAHTFKMNAQKLSSLISTLFKGELIDALMVGDHSYDLQAYLVETVPDYLTPEVYAGFVQKPAPPQVLPQLWQEAMIEVASSISEVATKVASTIGRMPSKQGSMVFKHLAAMSKLRLTIGDYKASIVHQAVPDALVILDVSGSMTEQTIRTIVDDVVGLSWKANAHLAIVSNSAFLWEPGTYDTDAVLKRAEYGGTHYEELLPLFDRDWGTVISIADYDSSYDVKRYFRQKTGRVGKLFDISLVSKPTFLAECVAERADEVQLLMVSQGILSEYY